MTRIYEELFIVKPDAPDEEVDAFVETIKTQLTTAGATVDKVDKWGKRRLAYRVDKYREGTYVLFQFTCEPGAGANTEPFVLALKAHDGKRAKTGIAVAAAQGKVENAQNGP